MGASDWCIFILDGGEGGHHIIPRRSIPSLRVIQSPRISHRHYASVHFRLSVSFSLPGRLLACSFKTSAVMEAMTAFLSSALDRRPRPPGTTRRCARGANASTGTALGSLPAASRDHPPVWPRRPPRPGEKNSQEYFVSSKCWHSAYGNVHA